MYKIERITVLGEFIGYDRVSTANQNLSMQLDSLMEFGFFISFSDVGTGSSITENLFDTTSSNGKLILGIFAVLAEHERDRIRERTMPGLAVARAKGKLGGRLPLLSEAKRKIALDALNKENSVASVAKALGVSVMTIYRLLRRERDKELKVKDFRK